MMVTAFDVYREFIAAKASHQGRGYTLPKDWDRHFSEKMSKVNRDAIQKAANYFTTTWSNIDVGRFMRYGTELYGKSFTYTKFFKPELLNYYITKDKNIKREQEFNTGVVLDSVKFIIRYMRDNGIATLREYSRKRVKMLKTPILHHIKGHVDKHTLVYLINRRYLLLDEEDRAQIPYVVQQYRDVLAEVKALDRLFSTIEFKINSIFEGGKSELQREG
jgi:hypothetical protein